jgi:hypothetical protein
MASAGVFAGMMFRADALPGPELLDDARYSALREAWLDALGEREEARRGYTDAYCAHQEGEGGPAAVARAQAAAEVAERRAERAWGAVRLYMRGGVEEHDDPREGLPPAELLAEPERRVGEARERAAALRAEADQAEAEARGAERLVAWVRDVAAGRGRLAPWADVAAEPPPPEALSPEELAAAMAGLPTGPTAPPRHRAPSEEREERDQYRRSWEGLAGPVPVVPTTANED